MKFPLLNINSNCKKFINNLRTWRNYGWSWKWRWKRTDEVFSFRLNACWRLLEFSFEQRETSIMCSILWGREFQWQSEKWLCMSLFCHSFNLPNSVYDKVSQLIENRKTSLSLRYKQTTRKLIKALHQLYFKQKTWSILESNNNAEISRNLIQPTHMTLTRFSFNSNSHLLPHLSWENATHQMLTF